MELWYALIGNAWWASAAPAKRTSFFSIPFDIVTENHNQSKRETYTQLIKKTGLYHKMNFYLGTPPQYMEAMIDTQSSDLIILSESSSEAGFRHIFYPPSYSFNLTKSKTFHNDEPEATFHNTYPDGGFAEGIIVRDTFMSDDTTIIKFPFCLVDSTNFNHNFIGLGIPNTDRPSFLELMKRGGAISYAAYSMWIDVSKGSNSGYIIFGGLNKRFVGSGLYRFPVVGTESTPKNKWEFAIKLSRVYLVNPGNKHQLLAETSVPLVLSVSTPMSRLPFSILENFYKAVGANDRGDGLWTVPCTLRNSGGSIALILSGIELTLPFDVIVVYDEYDELCLPGFLPGERAILGENVLRILYVVYDVENLEVGITKANRGVQFDPDHVVELKEGNYGMRAPRFYLSSIEDFVSSYKVTFNPVRNPKSLPPNQPTSKRIDIYDEI